MSEIVVCPYGCGKQWVGTSSRTASQPLDADACAEADRAVYANCTRLTNPDGSTRLLTMSDDDAYCRRAWMDAYLAELDPADGVDPGTGDPDKGGGVEKCPKAFLKVHVTDYEDQPIRDVDVNVSGLGKKKTDADGMADYGEVICGTYTATASKEDHAPEPGKPEGPSEATEYAPGEGATTQVELKLDPLVEIKTERLIIAGSEVHYDSEAGFWWKMMFIAGACTQARQATSADVTNIILVNVEYTPLEIDRLRACSNTNVILTTSKAAVLSHISDRPKKKLPSGKIEVTKLLEVYFFSHGLPGYISLNLEGTPNMDLYASDFASTPSDVFAPGGFIKSYACRTGILAPADVLIFNSLEEAHPELSLAQKLADHYSVPVHAFYRRSSYQQVIRVRADSDRIAEATNSGRTRAPWSSANIVDIPPEHEALPHEGLSESPNWNPGNPGWGGTWSGVNDYALWRKQGGRELPVAADTPTFGSSPSQTEMHVFTPSN